MTHKLSKIRLSNVVIYIVFTQVLAVVFLNIQSYSSGTRPWNRQAGEQRLDDGLLEVKRGLEAEATYLLENRGWTTAS